ncbi:putative glutamine synthetase-like protein [Phaeoacremonium minimum UCRPA7]|uniref:Glutamine synthetase n=1 Tax=Phaeoacremonium minimum (strain UCR-PA7) TaxID=1286976 RepID=R8BVQ7_PHAM7|nr:putative glutamine synthetase-like protein [Phaeoacremonium minimum UCRPA7]EOO03448.1 putative glutamine synthetase-like protein [Phaeoacremonium minimum UCRPA7]
MASWAGAGIGAKSGVTKAQLDAVLRAIRLTPIIDNHAHPLLKPEALGRHPLMSIITEASGDAIHAASTSLAHHRAVKQLSRVLGCGATWEDVVSAIEEKRVDEDDAWYNWVSDCLGGIETILIDDGLDNEQDVHDIAWHDQYTRNQCKRIVRIEAIAAAIINRYGMTYEKSMSDESLFDKMLDEFDAAIKEAIEDPEVVGFKSVICYRTGLDIPKIVNIALAKDSFTDIVVNFGILGQFKRLQHDGLNDLFVHRVAGLIRESPARHKKPIQFHTGLGDNDITLTKSSPSHLQEFIRAYPEVPIVILHASYPFTREAGYLACVYANVYADIGEVFPFVSEDGQEHIVRQILELCPWSKILWSTDGHWFPETYLLATLQVLTDYVRKGHIGWKAAIELTRDILFKNSNKLYQLELEFSEWNDDPSPSPDTQKGLTDEEIFETFLQGNSPPKFVRINWTDLTATPRMRMVPFRKFITSLQEGNSSDIGITTASLGLLQNDWIAPGFTGTGEYRLHPDFSSLKWGPIKGHASMYGEFREKDGSRVRICPRTQLHRAVDIAAEQGLAFLVGFEIEFLLVERSTSGDGKFETLTNDGHAWSVSQFFVDPKIPKLLADIVAELDSMGIYVEQLHPESAPGQFELILPPLPPVEAVDTLLHTREVISGMAAAAGYRFTLHPKPFPHTCGTASHAHMSISSPGGSKPQVYEKFYAGVLKHLCAILAFTYSNPVSYERLGDGVWAGGSWVSWGTQNRETALRKIEDSHWEFKLLDGVANPYLAMAAVFLAGTHGVVTREELVWRDCEIDPAQLTDNDRKELNVIKKLPTSLEAALKALEEDEEMTKLLGSEMVEKYTAVKLFELKFLSGMNDAERRQWIMERY